MQKNVASQKWVVFAFDETDNTAKAGDANQITAELSADGGAGGGNITDTNPTELEDGYYVFDISQAESNADYLLILPESSTGNIQVIGVPGAVWTTEPNMNKLSVDSNGRIDIIKVAGTTQTANDNAADINTLITQVGTAGDGLTSINLPNQTMTITGDITGNLSGTVGSVTGAVGSVAGNVDGKVAGNVDGTVAGKTPAEAGDAMTLAADAITAAKIADDAFSAEHFNTNCLTNDALDATFVTEIWSKAMADLAAGAPSATASVLVAINYLYEAWRNKSATTATLITIMKDDGSTPLVKSIIGDDDTTFAKAEFVDGT